MSSGTLAEMMGVAVDHENTISLTPLSCLEGGRSQCSDWLLIALQWAELDAPPISVLGRTVVSEEDEELYIRPIFDWCSPFVTGSLVFVAPVRRQVAAGSGRVVLCSSQVSVGVLLCAVDCVVWAVFVTQPVSGMATGSDRPDVDRPSRDVPILQRTQYVGRRDSWLTGTLRL